MSSAEILYDLPMSEYLRIDALSRGLVHRLAEMPPLHARKPVKQTDTMAFGLLVDCLITGPDAFDREFVVGLDNYQGKAAQKREDEQNASNAGCTLIRPKDKERAERLIEALKRKPVAWSLLKSDAAIYQPTIVWDEQGVLAKARPDVLHPDRGIVADLKITGDISDHALRSRIREYGYYLQAEWYLRGLDAVEKGRYSAFIDIFVEADEPHDTRIIMLSCEPWTTAAIMDIDKALPIYRRCKEAGVWPGYDDRAEELMPHGWWLRERGIEVADEQ